MNRPPDPFADALGRYLLATALVLLVTSVFVVLAS